MLHVYYFIIYYHLICYFKIKSGIEEQNVG